MENFYPIRINTLRDDEAVNFDVYIKVGAKYIHYIRTQDEMEAERLKNLKSKGIRKLYILPNHEDSYLLYLDRGIESLADTSKDIKTRAAFAHDTMITAAENAEKNLETQEGFDTQKKHFDLITDFILSERNAIKNMLASAGIAVDNNHHSANVSSLALALASKSGITDKTEIFELGTAALLHDLGKNRLKFDYQRPFNLYTADEKKSYKNHPQDGADMLAGKPYISPRILGLIAAHEEYGIGKGYPEKKNLFTLPIPYQILSLVNRFDHLGAELKLEPFKAMDAFFERHSEDYDENLISTLATILT
jgi:HD-GYP domain-containing protein (c-di-GMP phosphodiesterase class II)